MPGRRRSNISQQTRNAIRLRNIVNQSTEERQNAHEERRVSMGRLRASQAEEQREKARETNRLGIRYRRAQGRDQLRNNLRRDASGINLNRAAFVYDFIIDYSSHPFVRIGQMDVVCEHCGALKFAGETPGLCCLNGKVKLPLLTSPPEPLRSLLSVETPESRYFLANTQQYNGCFQMTSFGANIIQEPGFNPSFKVI